MKVSREQFADHRKRILDAAAQLFRQRGFDKVTVAEVMSAAGLTHGGFYGHFGSKDALIEAAMAHELTGRRDRPTLEEASRYADGYLSRQHRDNIGVSCPLSALGTEAARASPAVRQVLTESLEERIENLSTGTDGATPEDRRRNAVAALATLVGGMVLARLVTDERLSEEILVAARASLRL